ncbi:hypothetical protein G6F55_014084 [Rhizopus delemar]|nr:hypothetical protein G6F55_014084 [Rhizopus delemar]
MLHFCGEIRLNHWYRRAAEWHTDPVIKAIYKTVAQDEAPTPAPICSPPGVLEDRRADGVGRPHPAGVAPDQPAREHGPVPQRYGAVALARTGLAGALAGHADPL